MSDYIPTIGLEIHAELKTRTKMFCDSANDPEETRPNTNVCPVCLAHPGALPTINKEAVKDVIKVGLALGGNIAPMTKFDRKNYFYPDLPKGYQISQYDMPLVEGGELHGVRLTRIHLEEDTATSSHDAGDYTLIDFNRAGVPLMELVTEPDIHDKDTAVEFAKELQRVLRYVGVSDANMEKGQMRVEVNISFAKKGEPFGTKVEVKNINSFKAVEGAIIYETKRQIELLETGGEIVQETRGWDDVKRITVSQRKKENANDYRYFPEPDLPPFETSIFGVEKLRSELPELPEAKRIRFMSEFSLSRQQAEALADNIPLANFYEAAASELAQREKEEREDEVGIKKAQALLFNYLTSDLAGIMTARGISFEEGLKVTPENLAELVDLIADQKIQSRQAKDILTIMVARGGDPEDIMKEEGLETVSDAGALESAVREVIEANPKAVEDYKKGKEASVQFLVGQCMRKLRGTGDPNTLKDLILSALKEA
jgi:aspartyl-tRNA(Asn)/glutamyl-tRNA(Gln) amidotransferase subunit B